jgi:PadR family transcriptional regulator, regulatory protein PadR
MYYKRWKKMESFEFLKGTLKPIILKLLTDNKRLYGYQITQMVKEMTFEKIQLTEGALYPALHQLVDEGILKTETENIGNRKRIYYLLSDYGLINAPSKLKDTIEYITLLTGIFNIEPVKAK